MTRTRRIRTAVSSLLILAGAALLGLGAREFFGSRLGQVEAAREFAASRPVGSSAMPERIEPGDTLGLLEIPRLGVELYVVEGDAAPELRRGPGHLTGTALPGQPGNCVIAGHRDTHFHVLKDIRAGDKIVLETHSGRYTYVVDRTSVVLPRNTSALRPTPDSRLHLITCFPFYYVGSAPRRFVVNARLAVAQSRAEKNESIRTAGAASRLQ
jgi:sortase A